MAFEIKYTGSFFAFAKFNQFYVEGDFEGSVTNEPLLIVLSVLKVLGISNPSFLL